MVACRKSYCSMVVCQLQILLLSVAATAFEHPLPSYALFIAAAAALVGILFALYEATHFPRASWWEMLFVPRP